MTTQFNSSGSVLDDFASDLHKSGLVGEQRAAKLLYLCLTSRVLDRPVSAKVTGPSSGGKSNLINAVLRFFPAEAYLAFTSLSPKALIYTSEDLRHRMLIIQEAAGLSDGDGAYVIRSLQSEGRLVHETTIGGGAAGAFQTQRVEKEGPTGLILTTTEISIHQENETRLFTIPIDDSAEQIRAVLLAQATQRGAPSSADFKRWHELQNALATNTPQVEIPFAQVLAMSIPPVSNRLRRDFPALQSLIKSHALLNRDTRKRGESGQIIATMEDYAMVFALVADLISEGVNMTVPQDIRQTVRAAGEAGASRSRGVNNNQIAEALKLDKSTASRSVGKAVEAGFLRRQEPCGGQVSITLGDPLPDDQTILPPPEVLTKALVEASNE